MKPTVLAALLASAFSCSIHAQAPAGCDAPTVQRKIKEAFYTEVLNNGRAARAQRFADPYNGSQESFYAGIEAAGAKLQAEIKVREFVDQGYKDQIKARLCGATLVVADNQSLAVPTRYFVQRMTDGALKVATEFELPGGGGATSFNALMAFFGHFYTVAFSSPTAAPSSQASSQPPQAEPVAAKRSKKEMAADTPVDEIAADAYAEADKKLNAAYKGVMPALSADAKIKLRDEQRKWIKARDKGCGLTADDVPTSQTGRMDMYNCLAEATNSRTQELLKLVALR